MVEFLLLYLKLLDSSSYVEGRFMKSSNPIYLFLDSVRQPLGQSNKLNVNKQKKKKEEFKNIFPLTILGVR